MKTKWLISFFLLFSILISCIPEYIILGGSRLETYECMSRQMIQSCPEGLSSTLKSCYYLDDGVKRSYRCTEGWILFEEEPVPVPLPPPSQDKPYKQGSYHCYPSEGCCRKYGLLSNECIPMDVVG